MALIDGIALVIPNTTPEDVTTRQIVQAVTEALWKRLQENSEQRVRVHIWGATANPRARELYDAWAWLLGPPKPE